MSHHSSKLDLIWFTVDQWWHDMDCMVQKFANIEQNPFFPKLCIVHGTDSVGPQMIVQHECVSELKLKEVDSMFLVWFALLQNFFMCYFVHFSLIRYHVTFLLSFHFRLEKFRNHSFLIGWFLSILISWNGLDVLLILRLVWYCFTKMLYENGSVIWLMYPSCQHQFKTGRKKRR